ncbi:MAG: hypothetical protein OEL83_02960 [Desulforhopalus sp.]|nr:hypothetical protein [Desulforhopalus sp.]
MKNQDELIAQLAAILTTGEKVLATETTGSQQKSLVSEEKFHDFRISALSYLSRVFGPDSTYHQSFKSEVTHSTASRTRRGIGILTAAEKDLQGDWLETTRGAISRDVLTDMLRQARTQMEERNLRAATIIAGAVLEKHLRDICIAAGIKIHNEIQGKAVGKKGLQLTGEAYKRKLYERQENKEVIAWLELFAKAAEAKSDDLPAEQVKNMVSGVLSFLTKIRH